MRWANILILINKDILFCKNFKNYEKHNENRDTLARNHEGIICGEAVLKTYIYSETWF